MNTKSDKMYDLEYLDQLKCKCAKWYDNVYIPTNTLKNNEYFFTIMCTANQYRTRSYLTRLYQ